jgi:hypothetical protein
MEVEKENARAVYESPLRWPDGWSRTLIDHRHNRSAWKKMFQFYSESVVKELRRIGVSAITISRQGSDKENRDPGVAVWYSLKPASDFSWQIGLQLDNPIPSLDEIDSSFRRLAQKHHPDAVNNGSGGDVAMFHRLSEYRKQARAFVLGQNAPTLDNCIPCDKFTTPAQNMAAINLALKYFRGLERVGIPAILERVMDRTFRTALPAKASPSKEERDATVA